MRQHILSLSAFMLCSTAAFAQSQTVSELRISDNDATPATRQNVILQAPASSTLTADQTLVLPGVTPTTGQVLTVQSVAGSAATLAWGTPASAWGLTGNAGTNSGTNFLGTTDNISLRLRTNNTERMIVDSMGNVAIGTSNANIAGSSGTTLTVMGSANRGNIELANSNSLSSGTLLGTVSFSSPNFPGTLKQGAGINALADGAGGVNGLGGALAFRTKGDNESSVFERMRITSEGNVGIGTTTAATVASATSGSTAAQQLAKLTVTGGDAIISGVTVGTGGGQIGSNTAVGNQALYNNTTGNYNTANGAYSLNSNTSGLQNEANGYAALYSNTTGNYNSANGFGALYSNTTGNYNTANGLSALRLNTTGNNNSANGAEALQNNTTGAQNTASGTKALYSNTTGNNNTANGYQSLFSNTTGHINTANGLQSLFSNTTGAYNTANGYQSLYSNTTGNNNTANGYQSLFSNTTGYFNTANGLQSLSYTTTGAYNTANGYQSLYSNTTGDSNTALGYMAGYYQTSGDNNIMIGANTDVPSLTGSNQMNIGNLIYGTGMTGTSAAPAGNVGIGTATPGEKLHVAGNILSQPVVAADAAIYLRHGSIAVNNGFEADITSNMKFLTAGAEKMRITSGGNVGIGTTSPLYKLHVVENNTSNLWVGIKNNSGELLLGYNSSKSAAAMESTADIEFSSGASYPERMRITTTGNVGIGTTTPAHKLDVVGTAGLSTGTAWTNTSDMRLKENVKPYTRGLSEILKINPIYYSYTENSGLKNDPKYGQNIGISAQELRQIIPEAIATKEHMMKDGTVLKDALELTKADAMWFALINAVKELKAENDALKSSLSKSELKSEATAAKLEMIEAALSAQGINFGKTASK